MPRVEPGNVSQVKGAGKPNQAKTATTAGQNAAKGKFAQGKPVKTQHFNLSKQPNTAKAPAVKFQQGRHIQGSQNWHGQQYTVFRNYNSQWHNQNWWHNHYRNNIVFVFGAPYYWNAGYWYPAWGYAPNAYYAYDGPIYGYNSCRRIKWSRTCRRRCSNKAITKAKSTACSARSRGRQSPTTSVITVSI